jgi:nucleotide-binding universal stress UspA family protein
MDYILVPINFSECATNAAQYALKIAVKFNWNITLLHVVLPQFIVGPEQAFPLSTVELEEIAQDKLKAVQQLLNDELKSQTNSSVSVEIKVELGFPPDHIETYGKDEKCALIVMGTKGAKGLKKMLVGSMSSSVMKRVEKPIMLVPEVYSNHRIENILFATNFLLKDEIFGKELVALAKLFNAKLYCMHLSDDKHLDEDNIRMADLKEELMADKYGVEVKFDVVNSPIKDTEEAIDQYIEANQIDLLAVHMMHRISLLHQLDHPSITRKLALDIKLPLLIFS